MCFNVDGFALRSSLVSTCVCILKRQKIVDVKLTGSLIALDPAGVLWVNHSLRLGRGSSADFDCSCIKHDVFYLLIIHTEVAPDPHHPTTTPTKSVLSFLEYPKHVGEEKDFVRLHGIVLFIYLFKKS